MRILIVGNGGREHALLWKLLRDAPDAEFFATRPTPGMAPMCEAVEIAPTDVAALADWATSHRIDLTVVGPEGPLAAGIVDRFQSRGLPIFGPTQAAARIESSKSYSKALMRNANVPTAAHKTFSNREAAIGWVREQGAPIVVKASGLAAGKGVVVCMTVEMALEAIDAMLEDLAYGEAGREIVIEEYMDGEEISLFAVCDGQDFLLLQPSQDHKRVGAKDRGPNTGGMGAYAPVSIADSKVLDEARTEIIAPTLAAMTADGCPFQGFLYAGLMKTEEGLKVVEFNCRFGDPEAQVVLPLLESSLLDLLVTVAQGGSIAGRTVTSREGSAVTTVVASGGYPGSYEKGKAMTIPEKLFNGNMIVFHAGTATANGVTVTAGGRVVSVTAIAPTFLEAARNSRESAAQIEFEGAFFRRDIGWRERDRIQVGDQA